MNEQGHLTSEERAAYWQGSLTPQALLAASDHLQECIFCRETLRNEKPSAISPNDEAPAVTYEELVAWMDGALDPLERRELSERISGSPKTAAELVNLLRFRDEMNQLPAEDYSAADGHRFRWGPRWVLPLAAGLLLGVGFLWLSSHEREQDRQFTLVDQGQPLVVRRDGQIPALGRLPEDLRKAVQDAVSSGKVDLAPSLAELQASRETLAGRASPSAGLRALAPVGTMVDSGKPTFRWTGRSDATGYRLNLLSKSSGKLISSPPLSAGETSWIPHDGLSPNETYEWEVEALRDGELLAKAPAPPEPEARFRVLDSATQAELDRVRHAFAGSHLVLGLAYAKAGLMAEAESEFEKLKEENPSSPLPSQLLTRLTNPAKH